MISASQVRNSLSSIKFKDKFSVIGDHGFYQKKFGLKNFLNDWNIQGEYIAQGKDKVKFNMFEDLKDQDGKW